jgi:hypothetical protein
MPAGPNWKYEKFEAATADTIFDSPERFDEPPRWGEPHKPRTQTRVRILSVRPAHSGAVGPAGQPATHIITVETESRILDCFIDLRSATLLSAIAEYLPPIV